MSRQAVKTIDSKRVDFETDDEINEQLDKIGFNIGIRLIEDYLARGNPGRCQDMKEMAAAICKGFQMFLGVTPAAEKFSATGDEFSLILEQNPLTEFVDLPPEHPKLLYSNVLAGAIRGALYNVQIEVDVRCVQDRLRGDQNNELHAWLIKALRLVHSKKPSDHERLRRMYKEACENETLLSRITLTEALREQKDTAQASDASNEPPRIRPAGFSLDTLSTSGPSTSDGVPMATAVGPPLPATNSAITTNPAPSTVGAAAKLAGGKRAKVAFFNMFERNVAANSPLTTTSTAGPVLPPHRIPLARATGTTSTATNSSVLSRPSFLPLGGGDPSHVPTVDQPLSSSLTSNKALPDVITPLDGGVGSEPGEPGSGHSAGDVLVVVDVDTPKASVPGGGSSKPENTADAHLLASLVADLVCCVCGKLNRPAQLDPEGRSRKTNLMVECRQCGALYHQLCHQPPVLKSPASDQHWKCSACSQPPESMVVVVPEQAAAPTDSDLVVAVGDQVVTTAAGSNPGVANPTPAPVVVLGGARKRKGGLGATYISAPANRS